MFLVVSGSSRHGREGGTEQRCSYYGGQEAERGTKLGSCHDLPRHGSGNLLPLAVLPVLRFALITLLESGARFTCEP